MPRLNGLVVSLCLAIAAPAQSWASTSPQDQKAKLNLALQTIETEPQAGLELLRELAAQDHAKSLDRLAYFALKGVGQPIDPALAIDLYQRAIDAGHTRSLISLAKTQVKVGQYDQAFASFEAAMELDLKGAEVAFLISHANAQLGHHSDPEMAWPRLVELAQAGDRNAQLGALYVASKSNRKIADDSRIVNSLLSKAEAGDGKAAETLLRYLRTQTSKQSQYLEIRQSLVTHDKIRPRVMTEEQLYLAQTQSPGQFWTASETILQNADTSGYARGLFITSRINKNAYVRILQRELSELGYNPGRSSGYLTQRTILALAEFCQDQNINDVCRHGPLKSAAIKLVATELTKVKF